MRERSRWAFFNRLLNEGGDAGSPETAGAEGEGAYRDGDAPKITLGYGVRPYLLALAAPRA